jgi:tetratricopeptide (TPR) repeat protein
MVSRRHRSIRRWVRLSSLALLLVAAGSSFAGSADATPPRPAPQAPGPGTPVALESPEEAFARGNAAYQRGDFDQAAQAYRAVLDDDVRDARVEYNLGNAEFKRGRLGLAILHYLRAHRLDPTDEDIRANLDYASSLTVDRVPEDQVAGVIRWLRGVQNRIGPDRQAWLAVVLVWAVAALVAWGLARPGRWNPVYGWSTAALVLALAIVAASWSVTHERLAGRPLAVVLQPSVEVLAGPAVNNATLFTVHEGLTVEVRGEAGSDWIQVSLPNGLTGWMPAESVGVV